MKGLENSRDLIHQWLNEMDMRTAAQLLLKFFTKESCLNIVTGQMRWVLNLFNIEIHNISGPYWNDDLNFMAIYQNGQEIERIGTNHAKRALGPIKEGEWDITI